MSSVNSFQRDVRLSVWTTNSAFTVTLLFYIHPQYTYQPPEMNVSILSGHYEVHPVVLSINYISIIPMSSSHIRGYSILWVEIRMSTRWSTECIVDGLVQNPSCPSFFDHPKTLNSLEFSQNQGCLTRWTWRFGRRFRTRMDGHTCPSVLFRRTSACKIFFTIFFSLWVTLVKLTWQT